MPHSRRDAVREARPGVTPRVLVPLDGGRAATGTGPSCLVSIYGPDLGRRHLLERSELLIGRDESCDVCVPIDTISRRHCRISTRAEGVFLCDLGSTNGTWVDDEPLKPRAERPLHSGQRVRVGAAIFTFLQGNDVEALYHEEIHRLAVVDGLTRAYNRRHLLEFLEREMRRSHRHRRPLSVVLFDVDHFKRINDDFGHLTGDAVLRELADRVRARIRSEDCFARHGGEEFAVVLAESDLASARAFAERVRERVAGTPFEADGASIRVTVSVGVATLTADLQEPERFLAAADERLHQAKAAGRDRVAG
jgi:two-component system cell cycle response regulator